MIKQVSRNLPETNSSSSHTIVIDTENINLVDKNIWKLDTIDGIIHIKINNHRLEFGRNYEKFNDVYSKILYACSLIHAENETIKDIFNDLLSVKEVILEFTGEKDVVFDWIPEFFKKINKIKLDQAEDNLDFLHLEEFSIPSIDHQSIDKYQEIFENKDTLKNFLFNKNSWFVTMDDGTELTEELFLTKGKDIDKISGGKIIIHMGEDIGDIHHEFREYPTTIMKELGKESLFCDNITQTMLKSIIFDNNKKRILKNNKSNNNLYYLGVIDNKLVWGTNNWKESYVNESLTNPNISEKHRLDYLVNLYPKEVIIKECEIYSNEFGLC